MKNISPFIDLYRHAEDYFFKGIASKSLNLGNKAHAYMTDVPTADLNCVYIIKGAKNLDNILRQSHHFFSQYNLPFSVIIPQELCTAGAKVIFHNLGHHQTHRSVSMVLELDDFDPHGFSHLNDTLIFENNEKLEEWMAPLIGAFESTPDISQTYIQAHERALKNNIGLHHFSLYKQGIPTASITLSIQGTLARVDDVGTLPGFQGRGYATQLIHYALEIARKLGAHYCFLEASDMGFKIYERLGFKPLFTNNIYSKKV